MRIERIEHAHADGGEGLLALIFRLAAPFPPGISFLTRPELGLQVGVMSHPAGHVVEPHVHLPTPHRIVGTPEVLLVRKGRVHVDFYSDVYREWAGSAELGEGDVILLLAGGHGFRMLEPTELIEIKIGPYPGAENDKTKFRFLR